MERKLTGELVQKFGKTSQGCPCFSEIMQICDFLFSASSFGHDHSKLDNSGTADRDPYFKMEIL